VQPHWSIPEVLLLLPLLLPLPADDDEDIPLPADDDEDIPLPIDDEDMALLPADDALLLLLDELLQNG
jgi:hypothetical protein